MIWLLSVLLPLIPVHARTHRAYRAPKTEKSISLTKVGSCAPAETSVMIIKQWHLAPTTVTKGFKEKYPHERNQTAIYKSLADSVKKKKVDLIVSEGCEGEVTSEFKPLFNGWDYESLHKVAQTKGYEKILTLVPLKLKARFGDDVTVLCGDSEALIQEGNLHLSNLRGWMGFWTRLNEKYTDDRGKLYADAAAELLKVPKTTPVPELLKQINARLKEELTEFKTSLNKRNDQFVATLKGQKFKTAAIVIGGAHADDLKTKLQAAGLGCDVFEPPGYQREAEQLISEFESSLVTADVKSANANTPAPAATESK